MALPSKQRDYPQLLVFDITNVRAVLRKAFDWIFQLDANLEALKAKVDVPVTVPSAVGYLEDLHNQRETVHGPADLPLGSTYYETDRGVSYQIRMVSAAKAWVYFSGKMRGTQSTLPTDLGVADTGFLFEVTDYAHLLQWSGTGWGWAPGDEQSNYIRGWLAAPSPATGWKLVDGKGDDGSTIGASHPVKYLKSDGTLGSITSATVAPCLPDLTAGTNFLALGAANTGTNAAVAPTINTEPTVSSDSAGTPTGSADNATLSTTSSFQSGGAATAVTQVSHNHTLTMNAMGTHTHTLSGGIWNADGTPKSVVLIPYYRK